MVNVSTNIGKSDQAGRPRMPKPVIARSADSNTGFDWPSKQLQPEALQRVYDGYMKHGELPPGFKPQGVMTNTPQESLRRRSISRGWAEKKASMIR